MYSQVSKGIEKQSGAARCGCWFVYKCKTREHTTQFSLNNLFIVMFVAEIFNRPGDLKGHKHLAERAKPISEQHGAVQCQHCH